MMLKFFLIANLIVGTWCLIVFSFVVLEATRLFHEKHPTIISLHTSNYEFAISIFRSFLLSFVPIVNIIWLITLTFGYPSIIQNTIKSIEKKYLDEE